MHIIPQVPVDKIFRINGPVKEVRFNIGQAVIAKMLEEGGHFFCSLIPVEGTDKGIQRQFNNTGVGIIKRVLPGNMGHRVLLPRYFPGLGKSIYCDKKQDDVYECSVHGSQR